MKHLLPRLVAPVLVGMTVMAFAGTPVAGARVAAPNAHAASFVGTYATRAKLDAETKYSRSTITVNADGTVAGTHGTFAKWSNSGKTITITYTSKSVSEVLTAPQTKKGLGSKKSPGTFEISSGGDTATGTWWAIKATP